MMMMKNMNITRKQHPTIRNRFLNSNSPPRYVRLTASDRWIEGGTTCGASSSRGGDSCQGLVRKGYVPVMVGGEGVRERFLIPTQLMTHPSILSLLELSAEEFGYKQEGVIQIPCEPDYFRDVIKTLPFKMKRS